jgi:hypothetical protein
VLRTQLTASRFRCERDVIRARFAFDAAIFFRAWRYTSVVSLGFALSRVAVFAALAFPLAACDSRAGRGAPEDGAVAPNCSEWDAAWKREPIGKANGFTPSPKEDPGTPSRRVVEMRTLASRGLSGLTVDDRGDVWRWTAAKSRDRADYRLVGKIGGKALADITGPRHAAALSALCPERATGISDGDSFGVYAFIWRDGAEQEVLLQSSGVTEQVRASKEAIEIARWVKGLSIATQVRDTATH